MNVRWARSIQSFQQLTTADQQLLLEGSWSQLLILSMAQWGLSLERVELVGEEEEEERAHLTGQLHNLTDITRRLIQLRYNIALFQTKTRAKLNTWKGLNLYTNIQN
jgi:DNA-directed RNA polymerase specialized sigma subunit